MPTEATSTSTPPAAPAQAERAARPPVLTVARVVSFLVLVGILIVIATIFFRVMAGFLVPLFLAAMLGVVIQPLHRWILGKCRGYRHLAAGITTSLVLLIVLLPIGLVITTATLEGLSLIDQLQLADVRTKLDTLRENLHLNMPQRDNLHRFEALLKRWRAQELAGELPAIDKTLVENLLDRADEMEAWIKGQGPDAPDADITKLREALLMLRDARPGSVQSDSALWQADAEFKEFKRDLLGGTYQAWLADTANPDRQADGAIAPQLAFRGGPRAVAGRRYARPGRQAAVWHSDLDRGPVLLPGGRPKDGRGPDPPLAAGRAARPRAGRRIRPRLPGDRLGHAALGPRAGLARGDRVLFRRPPRLGVHAHVADDGALAGAVHRRGSRLDSDVALSLLLRRQPGRGDWRWPSMARASFPRPTTSSSRSVLSGQSNLHPLLALLSVIGGLQALGPIGIVVGPMAVVFLQTLLRLLQRELSSIDRSSWTFWRGFGNPGDDRARHRARRPRTTPPTEVPPEVPATDSAELPRPIPSAAKPPAQRQRQPGREQAAAAPARRGTEKSGENDPLGSRFSYLPRLSHSATMPPLLTPPRMGVQP